MNGEWFGFLIWESFGAGFILWGLYLLSGRKKSPVRFWANAKPLSPEEITDVGIYNRAVGKLVSAYGIAIGLLGILLLKLDDSAAVFVPIVMLMILTIAMMATMMRIENKYRIRRRR